ncbi:hypothetical protein [Pseudomonas helleri]|uniref:hypothetical protein n=1 Tax=Pseudomonas helleri TaxID=1608996 RepID=UPI000A6EE713|nr:hypothetical protein [Pseudomonas helleri]
MYEVSLTHAVLDDLCGKVNLRRQSLPNVEDVSDFPKHSAFWSSDYACVLLWPILGNDVNDLIEGAAVAQDYLNGVLGEMDKLSKHIDGYLVLALNEKPSQEMDLVVRSLELSTNICRKNAIWPELNGGSYCWSRISDVSVLGLPGLAPKSSEKLTWPVMDKDVRLLWLEVCEIVAKSVGDSHAC